MRLAYGDPGHPHWSTSLPDRHFIPVYKHGLACKRKFGISSGGGGTRHTFCVPMAHPDVSATGIAEEIGQRGCIWDDDAEG